MGVTTANYKFQKPTDGGDDDVWGTAYAPADDPGVDPSPGLNGNWEKADVLLKAFQDRIDVLDQALSDLPQKLQDAEVKVGQLIFVTWTEDPADKLGYGTWSRWEPGRAVIGVGNGWTIGERRGSSAVLLSTTQIPAHKHTVTPSTITSTSAGSHNHTVSEGAGTGSAGGVGGSATNQGTTSVSFSNLAGHVHSVDFGTVDTTAVGGGMAHNNLQPSKAAFIWQRTA